ncbi:diguanylate cyclase [Alphaproteobacteria bacterium HT1-32]|nr:diguanylate cyclase [Alphaproteobacteria bacterium HT1-32]
MKLPETQPKILIVDDEHLNIEVLCDVLEDDGEMLFALNGETALQLAQEEIPDIILLDVMMPDMDGYEVCRRLKENPATAHIPIIFVTALSQVADETKGLELGATDFITKPVSPPVVRARVKNHVELKRYRDFLTEIAFVDGLTQIPNRRRYDQFLDTEWRRAIRRETSLSMVLMDIDHFKQYNDTYGHLEGDRCLQEVAAALEKSLMRPADLAARYGGEEFACLLPETDMAGAMHLAEKLRDAVEQLKLPHKSSLTAEHVTISVGVASVVASTEREPEDLFKRADKALYSAKETGRNKVVSADNCRD